MAEDDNNTKTELEENFQFLLPYGEILRTIVIDTALSDSDLKLVLKQKGIFLSRYDRNDSVPALMRTILSPNQFDELQDMRSEKIDKEKYRTSQIPWTGTNDLLGSLPKSFNLAEILESQFKYQTNTKLLGIPKFVKVDGRKDKVICNYEIEEELAMMSYHNRKKVYQGSLQLELKNDKNLVLHTVKTFTSPVTMDLSKRVEKDLEKHFKAEKKIEKEETFEKILFSNFNNKNRFKFFMNFLSDIDFLSYKNVVDFAIRPDFDYNIPKEATEFLKNLSQAKFKGNNLAKHMLLKDKFHECLHLESLVVRYNFVHSEGNGSSIVEYVFTDYRTDNLENSEFQFNTRVTFDSVFRGSGNKRKVERAIFEVLESHKMYYYNKFKTQN